LIADDDADHVEFLTDFLGPLGFITVTVADGAACLDAFDETRPDLVILDIAMPGMSGLEVAAALRRRAPAAKILIVSGNFHDAPRRNGAAAADYDGFVPKPTDLRALLDKIKTLLDISWIHEPQPALPARPDPLSMHRPGAAHLADLLQLGQIGYVRGIESKLSEIEQAEPDAADFCGHLRGMVRGFELARYMECLESLPELRGE
jgi:CheY-like chemotaxis protein